MYILKCADGSYYTGSTTNLELRLAQHQAGEGANHTKKHLPVKLVCFEEFERIDEAFYPEKQVQKWSRKKKEALINGDYQSLKQLAMAYRDLKKGGFGNLSHQNLLLPEALEGSIIEGNNKTADGLENLSHQELPKPEVLEGEVLEGEALQGSNMKTLKVLPEALEGSDDKPNSSV